MNNKLQINKQHTDLINAFAQSFSEAVKHFYETGRLLVQVFDKVPNAMDAIREAVPGISNETVEGFLAVGRGLVHERLFIAEGPGVERLRKCDIAIQRQYYSEPVSVLITENGKTSQLQVSVFDMTKEQAEQVFDRRVIRSVEQQRQWLQSRKSKPANVVTLKNPYTVRGERITVHEPCVFSRQQLALILAEMS